MKVILLRHVDKLGREGEIVNVSAGYARNYLFPRMLADTATPELVAYLDQRKKRQAKKAQADLIEAERIADKLDGRVFEISAKASAEGRLYAAITPAKVSELLHQQGHTVAPANIRTDHIKTTGEHTVWLRLRHGLEAKITILVSAFKE